MLKSLSRQPSEILRSLQEGVWLFTLLALAPTVGSAANAQPTGEYVGEITYSRISQLRGMTHVRAELLIPKSGKKFNATLTLHHFKEAIGIEMTSSTAELQGVFDERSGSMSLEFKKWMGAEPQDDYSPGRLRGTYDPAKDTIMGDGFKLGKRDSAATRTIVMIQSKMQQIELQRRKQEETENNGYYRAELRRVEAKRLDRAAQVHDGKSSAPDNSQLARAGGQKDKCRVIAKWVGRISREYGQTPDAMTVFRRFDVMVNLFRDEEFVPVFGRPYDKTSQTWRQETYTKQLAGCEFLASRDKELAGLLPFVPMLQGTFGSGGGAQFNPVTIIASLKERRTERARLDSLGKFQITEDLNGFNSIALELNRLSKPNPMLPSEIEATKSALLEGRKRLAARLVPKWTGEAERLPDTLATALEIYYGISMYQAVLEQLPAEDRTKAVAQMENRVDKILTAELATSMRALAELPKGEAGAKAGVGWSQKFEESFRHFERSAVTDARRTGEQSRTRLFDEAFPQWKARVESLPVGMAGLTRARESLRDTFAGHGAKVPSYRSYEEVVTRFRSGMLSQAEGLVSQAPNGSPESRKWMREVLLAQPIPAAEAVRGLRSVRLNIVYGPNGKAAAAALSAKDRERVIAEELTKIGLRVDSAAEAELSIHLDTDQSVVESRRGQTSRDSSDITSVWAVAWLRAPATVLRGQKFYRTLATISAPSAVKSILGASPNGSTVEIVLRSLIQALPEEANTRNSLPMTDDLWRELVLARIPDLNAVHEAFAATSTATGGGKRTTMKGITTYSRLEFGIRAPGKWNPEHDLSSFRAMLDNYGRRNSVRTDLAKELVVNLFDPRAKWQNLFNVSQWKPTADGQVGTDVRPIHTVTAWKELAQSVGMNSRSWYAFLDRAGIEERNCVVNLGSRNARVGCLAATEASMRFNLQGTEGLDRAQETATLIDEQSTGTIVRLTQLTQQ